MKKSRVFKAEIIVLACVAVLWAVNLRTHCVARATAGTLRQVIRIAPNSRCAHELLGSTYLYLGRTDEGEQTYRRAEVLACERTARLNPGDPNAHYALGDAYFDQERYEAAVEAYRRSIELDPNDFKAYYSLGIALDWLDRYEEEIAAFQGALRINPQDADAHFNIGDAYDKLGDFESAIRAYETVVSLDSERQDAYERLADCYWELDQPDKSVETWKRALETDPNWTWPHVRLAFDYNDLGRYDEAIAEWKQLIAREPNVAGLRVLLSDVYLNTGQYSEAIAACNEALRLKPEHPKAHYNLGRVHLQTGDIDSALREYAVLCSLDEKSAKLLRLGLRYVLTVVILATEHESDLRRLAEKEQEVKNKANTERTLRTAQLQAIDAMVAEGTISAAEGKLKQYDVVLQHGSAMDEIGNRMRLDLEALDVEREARPKAQELAESELEKIDQCIKLGLPLPTVELLEGGNAGASETDKQVVLPEGQVPIVRTAFEMIDGRLCALIGNVFVYQGDAVQGYRVKKIQADSVEFEKDGKTWAQRID